MVDSCRQQESTALPHRPMAVTRSVGGSMVFGGAAGSHPHSIKKEIIMFKLNRAAVMLSLVLAVSAAGAADMAETPAQYGRHALSANAEREIVIDAGTKWVNVSNGETVRFTKDGKSFTWRFEVLGNESSFHLSQIAPADFKVDGLRVFVAANPTYRG